MAAQQLGGVKNDDAMWIRNIGAIEIAQGSYSAAERYYREALRLARQMENDSVGGGLLADINRGLYERRNGEMSWRKRIAGEALALEQEIPEITHLNCMLLLRRVTSPVAITAFR